VHVFKTPKNDYKKIHTDVQSVPNLAAIILACSAIYFACVYFFLFSFFDDRSENNYLRICQTDVRSRFTI